MGINRTGYQPIKAPPAVKAYGVAAKWANGAGARAGNGPTASDLFFGPQTKGTDWGAVFANANGAVQDAALQDYVKRNYEKFSGPVLEAILEQAKLVDWYKETMQKKAADLAKSLQETIDEVDLSSLMSARTKDILASVESKSTATGAFSSGTAAETASTENSTPAPGSLVDVSV